MEFILLREYAAEVCGKTVSVALAATFTIHFISIAPYFMLK